MALGRERSQAAQLASELAGLRQQLKAREAAKESGGVNGGPASPGQERREAQKRLAETNARLAELSLSYEGARAELAKYKRALEREVGSVDGAARLLEGGSGARGRAEQISLLRDQLREAQRRAMTDNGGLAGGPSSPGSRGEERARERLQQMEQERRHDHERLLVVEQQLRAELDESRRRADALAARIKNLEADVRSKRDKLKLLLDKSDNDNQLVSALRAELERCRQSSGKLSPQGDVPARRVADLATRAAEQQAQIGRQEKIIGSLRERAAEVDRLSSENEKLRELVGLLQDKLSGAE
uniref:Uncharacterized protein n=2 Tax=Emiliania huxleyi TaxID=2903 RepID=A0A6V2MKL6_EMIHU|mmetsp:Transcript_17735/g.58289  ORF Transcript_17735/g.58289 Transcript_17735/m.58289 type:complete len:301 (-) Transcript_17735:166-1068(-)